MGATTLLHEAYLSLNSRDSTVFPGSPSGFMKYASRAMRGLIINYVTRGSTRRNGAARSRSPILTRTPSFRPTRAQLSKRLGDKRSMSSAGSDASLAELVDLKFFCGFTFGEIAAIRGVTERRCSATGPKRGCCCHGALNPGATKLDP